MIFIDTGAFIAKYFTGDSHHEKATKLWKTLEKSRSKLFTSNFVLDEVFTLLARKSYYDFAAEKASIIYESSAFEILRPDLETELGALRYFRKYSDQEVSFTDCISFQLMKERRIKKVFAFDKHFKLAGFQLL